MDVCFFFFSNIENDEFDTNRLATAPRPGTTLHTAAINETKMGKNGGRPRTSTGRPLTGMVINKFYNNKKKTVEI